MGDRILNDSNLLQRRMEYTKQKSSPVLLNHKSQNNINSKLSHMIEDDTISSTQTECVDFPVLQTLHILNTPKITNTTRNRRYRASSRANTSERAKSDHYITTSSK